jgi:integrase
VPPDGLPSPLARDFEASLRRHLTDAFLRSAKPPAAGRMELTDARCAGLVFRITSKSIKSWSFRFRVAGRLSRATIGRYPAIGLTAARGAADAMRAEVAGGGNPAQRKRQERNGAGSRTFGALAERYLAEHARRHKRSHHKDTRNLELHVLPHWRARAAAEIERGDVIELVERLITAGKPVAANRVQSVISRVFSFGIDAGSLKYNPCFRMKKRGAEKTGSRVLNDDEIRLFWAGIVESKRARLTGLGLRLALLTAARVSEIAGMCRAEIGHIGDSGKAAWTIPGSRTKNGKDHLIPLSPLARATVIDLLERRKPNEEFLFPTLVKRDGPIRGNALTKAMDYFGGRISSAAQTTLDEAARTWRLDPPTPHDLRRTVETRLAELRFPKEIRDRCLNHIPGDVGSKHYNRHDYADEKRDAFNRWDAVIASIVDGSSGAVVSIAEARKGVRNSA